MKNRLSSCWLIVLSTLWLCACGSTSPTVRVDKAADADFANYRSFHWLAPSDRPAGTLAEQRVRDAVTQALRSKGYAEDNEHPDLEVTFSLKTYERPKSSGMSVGIGAGGGSGHMGGGVGISLPIGKRREQAGTLTLDIFDAARKAQVWTGSLETSFDRGEITPPEANNAVAEILKKFPNRASP